MPQPRNTIAQSQQIEKEWQEQQDQARKEALLAFRYRERQRSKGFKVPHWLAIVVGIVLTAIGVWLFLIVVFNA